MFRKGRQSALGTYMYTDWGEKRFLFGEQNKINWETIFCDLNILVHTNILGI